ncbi:MAG: hypothetical protein JWR13_1034 [Mycobacterium sp.]|jgi:uncharacterized membrane protein|nr:hypothetical protein [Mycobacterium sp.]
MAAIEHPAAGYLTAMNIDKFWKALESNRNLDRTGDVVQKVLQPVVGRGAARNVLGGKWLGHPVHPALVMMPLGAWSSAVALDLAGNQSVAARRLIGLGTITAPAAIATGWSDWSNLNVVQRRVGLLHAAANAVAVTLFSLSYWRRGTVTDRTARVTGIVGLLAAGAGGSIGGHLAYRLGANVTAGHPELEAAAAYDPAQLPDAMERASGLDQ